MLLAPKGSWLTTLVAIAGPGYVMGTAQMQQELGISHIVAALSFSLYPLGFGMGKTTSPYRVCFTLMVVRVGPLVLAPISEIYGRNSLYWSSTLLFTREYICRSDARSKADS